MPRTNTEIDQDLATNKQALEQLKLTITDLRGELESFRKRARQNELHAKELLQVASANADQKLGALRELIDHRKRGIDEIQSKIDDVRKDLLTDIREIRRSRETFSIAILAVVLGAVGSGLIELLKHLFLH